MLLVGLADQGEMRLPLLNSRVGKLLSDVRVGERIKMYACP